MAPHGGRVTELGKQVMQPGCSAVLSAVGARWPHCGGPAPWHAPLLIFPHHRWIIRIRVLEPGRSSPCRPESIDGRCLTVGPRRGPLARDQREPVLGAVQLVGDHVLHVLLSWVSGRRTSPRSTGPGASTCRPAWWASARWAAGPPRAAPTPARAPPAPWRMPTAITRWDITRPALSRAEGQRAASSIWTGYPACSTLSVDGGVIIAADPRAGRRRRWP
jgi:hypothetical protein